MRKKGKIVFWNQAKGFGFVLPDSGKKQIFVHIRDFEPSSRQPSLNAVVRYIVSSDKQGRPCGKSVLLASERLIKMRWPEASIFTYIVILPFALFAGWSFYTGKISKVLLALYLLLSLITLIVYKIDKSAAQDDKRRIPESTLHVLSILGGWPGAILAQKVLHHKTQKQNFRFVFGISILLNVSLFLLFYTSYDSATLQALLKRLDNLIFSL